MLPSGLPLQAAATAYCSQTSGAAMGQEMTIVEGFTRREAMYKKLRISIVQRQPGYPFYVRVGIR